MDGYVHGSTRPHGLEPNSDSCLLDDVSSTIFRVVGITPNHEEQTTTGRLINFFREGKLIEKLLA